jgi:hypothetical protein
VFKGVKRKADLDVSGEANGAKAYLYVISYGVDRVKIGVARDARKRLRELQVGSPSVPSRQPRAALANDATTPSPIGLQPSGVSRFRQNATVTHLVVLPRKGDNSASLAETSLASAWRRRKRSWSSRCERQLAWPVPRGQVQCFAATGCGRLDLGRRAHREESPVPAL